METFVLTEATVFCARHPKEETAVSCASCGTPICPKCMVSTPVGMKCRDCASNRKSPLYHVRPGRLALAALTSLAAGAVSTMLQFLGFFAFLAAAPYGYFAGSLILRAAGRKRGLTLEITAGTGMVLGGLAAQLAPAALAGRIPWHQTAGVFSYGVFSLISPFFWMAVIISTACAVSKIRYL